MTKEEETIGNNAASPPIASSSVQNQELAEEELKCLYNFFSACKEKPSMLSIVPGFCNSYIPHSENGLLPKPLSSFFNEQLLEVSFSQLLERSIEILRNITISPEQAKSLEVLIRGQSHSKLWYQYRAGQITASKFKAAIHIYIQALLNHHNH